MEDKTREAAAIAAALMLARLAHLRFERDPDAPILPLRSYLHAPAAGLLLVPAVTEPRPSLVAEAIHVHRADALIVNVGGDKATDITFEAVLRGPKPIWIAPLRPWLGGTAPAYLVPDDPAFTSVALLRVGLRTCETPPWSDEGERLAGLGLGFAELTRVLEGR